MVNGHDSEDLTPVEYPMRPKHVRRMRDRLSVVEWRVAALFWGGLCLFTVFAVLLFRK